MGDLVRRVLVTAVVMVVGLGTPALVRDVPGAAVSAAGVPGQLLAVSCTGAGNCWAVGDLDQNGGALVEHWAGASWHVVAVENPPRASFSVLDGVACPQISRCWAVGYYDTTNGRATLPYAEAWDGRRWSEVTMPYPAGETLKVNLLRAVSCPTATTCFADGGWEDGSSSKSLIERWDGRCWRIVREPEVASVTDLQGLSCAGRRDCWAVGDWLQLPADSGGGLADHWNGTQWTAVRVGRVHPGGRDLYAVSCAARRMCMAIGTQYAAGPISLRPYAERWNGSSWMAAPIGTSTVLTVNGVSCATAWLCVAVGETPQPTMVATLVEQWNGWAWATIPSPNPPGASHTTLSGVACPQATNCWAVGQWTHDSGRGTVLIERWNGRSWTIAS